MHLKNEDLTSFSALILINVGFVHARINFTYQKKTQKKTLSSYCTLRAKLVCFLIFHFNKSDPFLLFLNNVLLVRIIPPTNKTD